MIEIEAKTKLKSSEGAHFFFTLIFLTASGLIERQYSEQTCGYQYSLLVDLVFYSQIIKGTYQLITMVPKYKNHDIILFFEFLDIAYYLFLFGLFVYANVLYFQAGFETCLIDAPIIAYFIQLFLVVTYFIFIVLVLSMITYLFRLASKSNVSEHDQLEDN
ncbi:hypothetical protein ABPG72_001566 [Tetrahymena utriculariae]